MRRDAAPVASKLSYIAPTSSCYHVLPDNFPTSEFSSPAMILEFFRANRFPGAFKEFSRPVRPGDVFEMRFIEPIMPSQFLLVVDQKDLLTWLEDCETRPLVFMFAASPLALVQLPIA